MLKWLFGPKSESKVAAIVQRGSIGYLSASCCNAAAAMADEQLVANLREAMAEVGLDLPIETETLTGAQAALGSLVSSLDIRQAAVVAKVTTLFSTKGLSAFPILFVNGEIATYGGVPGREVIVEHLRKHQAALEKSQAPAMQSETGRA